MGEGVAEEDPALVARVAEVSAFLVHLVKGIRNIGIYRHAETRYVEFLQPAFKALEPILAVEPALTLKLTPYALLFKKHTVYEDSSRENLTYRFYRDGMRFLMLRPGLPIEELLRFVILMTDSPTDDALSQEDMVTRLWKEQFHFIEYVVMDGFDFGEGEDEDADIEVDKIVGYLRAQLAAKGDDITRFARLSAEDLELELRDVEQVRGGIISGRTATPEDRTWVQEELYQEEKNRIFAKMVLILFQILEREATEEDVPSLLDAYVQVLDTLLLQEDVSGCVAMLQRFQRLAERSPDRRHLIDNIRDAYQRKMIEPQRIEAVGRYIMLSNKLDEAAVREYFANCGEEELITLLELLSTLERSEGRRVVIDVLAIHGAGHPELFARRLDHNSSNVVKDMLTILHKINPPDKLKMISKCLEHPNLMIRLEGLKILAKSPDEGAARYIELALKDNDIQMRVGGYRALAQRSGARAVPALLKLMQSDNFDSMEHRERVAIATALGETKAPEALTYFSSLFEQKAGLFARAKNNDLKGIAITGLAAHGTVDAFQVLAREVQNRTNSKEIAEAAHRAALRLKTALSQGAVPEETDV